MKKRWLGGVMALLLAGMPAASLVPAYTAYAEPAAATTGKTYYVDSESGSDNLNQG